MVCIDVQVRKRDSEEVGFGLYLIQQPPPGRPCFHQGVLESYTRLRESVYTLAGCILRWTTSTLPQPSVCPLAGVTSVYSLTLGIYMPTGGE